MKFCKTLALAAAALLFASANANAETKVELKGTHLCCGQCVKAVGDILKGVEGASGKCDQKNKTVTITAKDDETAQKALDALAAGGFHGDTGDKKLAIKDDSGVKAGKVKTLTLTEVHNCCGQCTNAIKKAVTSVSGVSGTDVKAKDTAFAVEGNFKPGEVVKALLDAGFYVQVKK